MAQYWEDWSGSTLDSEPTGWTKRFVTSGVTYTVQDDEDGPAGRRLRIKRTGNARSGISMDGVDSDADRATASVRALIRPSGLTTGSAALFSGVFARGAGSIGSETLVGSFISTQGEVSGVPNLSVRNSQYSGGTVSTLNADTTYQWSTGELYWLGLDIEDDEIICTLAAADTPGTPLVTVTSTTSVSGAGLIGLFIFGAAITLDVLAIGVGTNGDPAPLSALSDTTAPVLSSPTATATGATTASGTVSTDEGNGTLYWLATTNASEPGATVRGGSSKSVAASGSQSVTVSGLTGETGYYMHYLHRDAAGNDSQVVSSAQFTTDSESSIVKGVRVRLCDRSGTPRSSVTGIIATWWDDDTGDGAYDLRTTSASTDVDGWLELNINSVTTNDLADLGLLALLKTNSENPNEDFSALYRASVQDIAP